MLTNANRGNAPDQGCLGSEVAWDFFGFGARAVAGVWDMYAGVRRWLQVVVTTQLRTWRWCGG